MALIFKRTKELENQIDDYLDSVVRGALLFKQGIKYYIEGLTDEFENRITDLDELESKADDLRRDIENKLYAHTLIPESRGDVLGLLESSDRVLNKIAEILLQFSIETPAIPDDLHSLFMELSSTSVSSVEAMVMAIRSYFKNLPAVRDQTNKVLFYEKESDKIAEKIQRIVFKKDMELSKKMHINHFVNNIEKFADRAEDVCDRLEIATIKRHL